MLVQRFKPSIPAASADVTRQTPGMVETQPHRPKRLSKEPVGTVGAAPLIWPGACVDAVCCCGDCSAGSLFGRIAPGLVLLAVCLAGWSFFSEGLVLAVLVAGLAFGAGAAFSVLV